MPVFRGGGGGGSRGGAATTAATAAAAAAARAAGARAAGAGAARSVALLRPEVQPARAVSSPVILDLSQEVITGREAIRHGLVQRYVQVWPVVF